jgi:heme oxygenase
LLRQATAGHHARIEALLGLGGPFDRAHYGRVLQGFGAFLQEWEPRIARALPASAQAWFAQGRRAHLVRQDLQALGVPALSADEAVVPSIGSAAQAWGSLYVLEGSALGGQLIAQGLRRRLGIEAHNGGAYFSGCGSGTAARWREYRQRADEALTDRPADQAQAADAAVRTFETLITTFRFLLDERAIA